MCVGTLVVSGNRKGTHNAITSCLEQKTSSQFWLCSKNEDRICGCLSFLCREFLNQMRQMSVSKMGETSPSMGESILLHRERFAASKLNL